jgi:hypothetical protein
MSRTGTLNTADRRPPSARRVPRSCRGDGWNALADIEVFVFAVFVFAVEAELEAMDRERVGVPRRGCKPDFTLRRRLIGLIWPLTFGGLQWRIAGWLSAGSRGSPSPRCTAPSPAGGAVGCGAGWASAWPSIGAWPAAPRACPRR